MIDTNPTARPLDPAKRNRLIEIIAERSFQAGKEMKLASGRSSSFYFGILAQTHQDEKLRLYSNLLA